VRQNPFFNYLPMEGTKGELIIINAPKLNSEVIIKSSVFIIPIGKNDYLVGSTYAWDDFNNDPTINAKNKLLNKLDKLILCPYKVVYQRAGIRPTVIDRRPLVGQHKSHQNLYILNGLGSRGVLIAPTVANALINLIEDKLPLQKEINISRFD
jgi:glycine/D-amino acid oxidase-like deaminating enzyme